MNLEWVTLSIGEEALIILKATKSEYIYMSMVLGYAPTVLQKGGQKMHVKRHADLGAVGATRVVDLGDHLIVPTGQILLKSTWCACVFCLT